MELIMRKKTVMDEKHMQQFMPRLFTNLHFDLVIFWLGKVKKK